MKDSYVRLYYQKTPLRVRMLMFLSHSIIKQYIDEKLIIIRPEHDIKNIRPVGIRMHLGRYLLLPEPDQVVDLMSAVDLRYQEIDLLQEEFYILPGQFLLASTYEAIHTAPHILALLDGRSTIARLGLTTHVTASVIDGTYEKPQATTLEIKNVGNFKIRLRYKDPIAMMLFAELKGSVTQQMQSQYSTGLDRVMPPNMQFKTGIDR